MSELNLSLHSKQLRIFRDPARVKVLCAGRGFGKSMLMLIAAISFCIGYNEPINPASPQVAAVIMPTLKMARSIHWLPLLNLLETLPIVDSIDKSNFRIVFKGERPDLILRGADRAGDRLRGLNLCWAGLDEYQDFSPSVWPKILQPALARNRNWKALVIGTPKGRASHFYDFHEQALRQDEWAYFHAVTADNPFISRREIARARRELPPKVFRQEFEAGWEDFDGQLFAELQRHHIAAEVPASFKAVLLGADWGDVNPALVVVGVTHGGDYYLLDSWKNDTALPVTEDEVKERAAAFERAYGVFRCYLPDDRPGSVLSFRRYGKQHGLGGMRRAVQVQRGKPGVLERATICNSLFYQRRLFFTPKTAHLYDKFASYHRAKDRDGKLLSHPEKGQEDHEIDATLYVLGQLEGKYIQKKEAA